MCFLLLHFTLKFFTCQVKKNLFINKNIIYARREGRWWGAAMRRHAGCLRAAAHLHSQGGQLDRGSWSYWTPSPGRRIRARECLARLVRLPRMRHAPSESHPCSPHTQPLQPRESHCCCCHTILGGAPCLLQWHTLDGRCGDRQQLRRRRLRGLTPGRCSGVTQCSFGCWGGWVCAPGRVPIHGLG